MRCLPGSGPATGSYESQREKRGRIGFFDLAVGEETIRLALMHKRSEGVGLVDAYKRMILQVMTRTVKHVGR